MKKSLATQLEPRFENGKAMLIAGLRSRYTWEMMNGIFAQWQLFVPYIGKIPGQLGGAAYGVVFSVPGGVDYLSGVEVSSSSGLPAEFSVISLPAERYAVFAHRDHVLKLRETIDAIFNQWLPGSGYQVPRGAGGAPDFFERYSEEFNPQTGMNGIEVWVPIKG